MIGTKSYLAQLLRENWVFDYRCQVLKLMTVKPQWESQLRKYLTGQWEKSKTLDFTKAVNKHQRKQLSLSGDQENSECWFWGHPENSRSKTIPETGKKF